MLEQGEKGLSIHWQDFTGPLMNTGQIGYFRPLPACQVKLGLLKQVSAFLGLELQSSWDQHH